MHRTLSLLCALAFITGCEAIEDFEAVADQPTDPRDHCVVDEDQDPDDQNASVDGGLLDSIPPLPEVVGDDEADLPIVSGDVHLVGWATHEGLLAIRNVTVGGVEAETAPDSFNFRRWTATVPFAVLRALRGPDDIATVPIVTFDACEPGGAAVASFQVRPVLDAEAVVTELSADLSLPEGTGYLPTDAVAQATLVVTANREAVGSQVNLTLPSGVTSDLPDSTVTLRAEGDRAEARVLLSATDDAPDARRLVVVTSQARVDAVELSTAGPPTAQASTTSLAAGASASLFFSTEGTLADGTSSIQSCFATTSDPNVAVTSGDESLVGVILDTDSGLDVGDEGVTINVAAAPEAGGGTVEVTCEDVFGQDGSVTITISEPAP